MYVIGNILIAASYILDSLLFAYTIVVFASIIASWLHANPTAPLMRIINQLTLPVYYKIRKRLPETASGIDFAPLVLLIGIMLIQKGILPSIITFAASLK